MRYYNPNAEFMFGGIGLTEGARQYFGGPTSAAPVRAYHGTMSDVKGQLRPGTDAPDRMLGPHLSADPALASAFGSGLYRGGSREGGVAKGGRVYPASVSGKYLQVDQPAYSWRNPMKHRPWEGIETDQVAVAKLISQEGYKARPDLLQRFLQEARMIPEPKARQMATDLVKGRAVDLEGRKYTLNQLIDNFTGATPFNRADRRALVDAARRSLRDKGYDGISYINTSPNETANIENPMSYIPIRRGTVKSATTGGSLYGLLGLLASGFGEEQNQKK